MAQRALLYILALILFVSFLPYPAKAQPSENMEDEITWEQVIGSGLPNEKIDEPEGKNMPATAADYANEYYGQCVAPDHAVYTKDEQKLICSCTAANMSQTLDLEDFKMLYNEDVAGQDVRDKALVYAYAPCFKKIAKEIYRRDCYSSKQTAQYSSKEKESICSCGVERMEDTINRVMPMEIIKIVKYNPLTLDPMEYYLISDSYAVQARRIFSKCAYLYSYQKNNSSK